MHLVFTFPFPVVPGADHPNIQYLVSSLNLIPLKSLVKLPTAGTPSPRSAFYF